MLHSIRAVIAVRLLLFLTAAWCMTLLACNDAATTPSYPIKTRVFLSETYLVDQIYRSMVGPMNTVTLEIGEAGPPELIWIVSYETQIVDAATGEKAADEFMCHNNLDFKNLRHHQALLPGKTSGLTTRRLFTLSQGAMRVEFPQGFGIPIMSNERFRQNTQVLNLNPIDEPRNVQYKTTVRYVRESDAKGRVRPLYQKGLQGMKLVKGRDGYVGVKNGRPEIHGESCSIGEPATEAKGRDGLGRVATSHWVVKPGQEENHTYSTKRLGLKRDTTAHYVGVHLHPFAESLELRDLTTGETVFLARATNSADKIGLEFVESFSSVEGIPLYKDHEYTLISIYDNRSGEDQDAMASMFIYLLDKGFEVAAKLRGT